MATAMRVTTRDDLIRAIADAVIGEEHGTPRDDQAIREATEYVDALPKHAALVVAFLAIDADEMREMIEAELNAAHAALEPEPEPEGPRCPHCGSEPDDWTSHREGCPTIGTCAQCHTDLPKPWHPESDWLVPGQRFSVEALRVHMREAHS